jgi:putative flavoprotein involved in K+ transport
MNESVDVLVIGGGQAGLAASWRLKEAGVGHLVVDASARVGDTWRNRYDSLTLFTPRHFSNLPGVPLAGDAEGYATRLEFADYLQAYAQRNSLPVWGSTRVVTLRQSDRSFLARLDTGATVAARTVIVCTGAFQEPLVPTLASTFASSVTQLTAGSYRNPTSVPRGTVLVVGDGASGRDIAVNLAATHRVLLATGKPRRLFPDRILGQSIWTWMDRVGLLSVSPDSPIGRAIQAADPFPDRGRSIRTLRTLGIQVHPRLVEAAGSMARFADGDAVQVSSVVWAVGYRNRHEWIEADTNADGLFFLGRPWLRNRASGLILGANRDSDSIVEGAADRLTNR